MEYNTMEGVAKLGLITKLQSVTCTDMNRFFVFYVCFDVLLCLV